MVVASSLVLLWQGTGALAVGASHPGGLILLAGERPMRCPRGRSIGIGCVFVSVVAIAGLHHFAFECSCKLKEARGALSKTHLCNLPRSIAESSDAGGRNSKVRAHRKVRSCRHDIGNEGKHVRSALSCNASQQAQLVCVCCVWPNRPGRRLEHRPSVLRVDVCHCVFLVSSAHRASHAHGAFPTSAPAAGAPLRRRRHCSRRCRAWRCGRRGPRAAAAVGRCGRHLAGRCSPPPPTAVGRCMRSLGALRAL